MTLDYHGLCCGNPLPDDRVQQSLARGFNLFRTNAAHATEVSVEQFTKFGARPLWVVGVYGTDGTSILRTKDEVLKLPPGSMVELGNELNIGDAPAGMPRMSPEQYAFVAEELRDLFAQRGDTVYYGATSSISSKGPVEWLRSVLKLCPWIERCSVHRYPYDGTQNPVLTAYGTRAQELTALMDVLWTRRVLVTEIGIKCGDKVWHAGWPKQKTWFGISEAQQLAYLRQEVRYWEQCANCDGVVVWVEGGAPQEQYGVREGTDGRWRMAGDELFKDYAPPTPPQPSGRTVSFKSWHGFYLSAQPDGSLQCNRAEVGAWEQFTPEPQPNGLTAYRTCFNTYLRAVDTGEMDCISISVGPWESFAQMTGYEGKGACLGTWHGTFVRAEDNNLTVDQADECGPWETWDLGHVDPSVFTLEQLATIRGGMWVNRAAIPYGPRPGQPSNINAMDYYQWYNATDRATMLAAYRAQGYTHAVTGPVIDSGGYHGQYPTYPGPLTQDWWDTYLDAMQEWWDAGIVPVHFACPDEADWPLDRIQRELGPFFAQERAQRLLRVLVLAWEPSSWTNARYVETAKWLHGLFPNALMCLHTEPNHNAPGLSSEIEAGMTEAQMWANVAPYIHCFLQQTDAPFRGNAEDQQEWLRMWDRRYQGSWDSRFLDGYHGWPTYSAWGTHGILAYPAEYMSYDCYWNNTPESVAQSWGDRAMSYGARGYLDGGTVAV